MKIKIYIGLVLLVFLMAGCFKTPSYPEEPVITFNGFTNTNAVYTLGEPGSLLVDFTDGDGDLGLRGADSSSKMFLINVQDSLLSFPYNIPEIPRKGTSIAIDGTIDVKLTSLFSETDYTLYFLTKGITQDTFQFNVYITDRSGNSSNVILTPPMIVKLP